MSAQAFSQQTNSKQFSPKEDFLQKSKNKKRTGWILLGTGVAAMAVGIPIAASGDRSLNSFNKQVTGGLIAVTGGGLTLTSLFFFASSYKYKRKAAAISFKMEKIVQPYQHGFVQSAIPALKLKIAF